jgi:hypothetical protein
LAGKQERGFLHESITVPPQRFALRLPMPC